MVLASALQWDSKPHDAGEQCVEEGQAKVFAGFWGHATVAKVPEWK